MPHRIASLFSLSFSSIADICVLGFLAVWQGMLAIITDTDWERITGPHGLVFVLIIAITIIWAKSVKDDTSRERRHRETIKSQELHFKTLIDLNTKAADDLRILTVASTKAQLAATSAVVSMDKNIINLTNEVAAHSRTMNEHVTYCKTITELKY